MSSPEDVVVSLAVRLPERTATSGSSFSCVRTPAEVILTFEGGEEGVERVAVRTARALDSGDIALPSTYKSVREQIVAVEERACYAYLLDLLSRRDHSIGEARGKLASQGFSPNALEAALLRACDQRFLDDPRFASYYIEERKRRGWGRRRIECELRQKGVDTSDLPGYPEEYFDDNLDTERALALLRRKRIPETKAYEKLVRFLVGKGFDFSLASRAVKEYLRD